MSYFDKFASHGLSIPLITTPGDFLDPDHDETKRVYATCQEAGVENIKIGYWKWSVGTDYWQEIDRLRGVLDQFQKLSKRKYTFNVPFQQIFKSQLITENIL